MALWHLGKNIGEAPLGTDILPASGRPASLTTIAIDCSRAGSPHFNTHADASPRSLWGELFYLLGGVEALKSLGEADDPEASPNGNQLEAVLPPGPILFLLDELVIYMAKLSERGQGNLLGFLNLLIAVVGQRAQTVLVVSDPAQQAVYARQSARMASELESSSRNLEEIFGRKMTSIDPIGDESAKVIVRRLFGDIKPESARQTARSYSDLYQRVAASSPQLLPTGGATPPASPGYKAMLEACYPFHPRLLKTAEERLSAMDAFQRSRGVLRLFARVVRDEVLVRMSVARVAVDHRLLHSRLVGERARASDGARQDGVGHRPVRGHLAPAVRATRVSALVHVRGNRVPHAPRARPPAP